MMNLVLAEPDNTSMKAATLNTIAALQEIGALTCSWQVTTT
jgi:hypothetical protein